MDKKQTIHNQIIYLFFVAGLFVLLFTHVFQWMYGRWTYPGSYYSHGFLIPFMSGYIIWKRWSQLKNISWRTGNLGLFAVLIGCIIHLISTFLEVYFISGLAILWILLGMIYYLVGFESLKILFFPVIYLFFMIPMPMVMIADLSLQLKLLTSRWALEFISWFGITTVQDGSTVFFSKGVMVIGDICSGLKSLIALLAFSIFYANFTKFRFVKKTLFFIFSAPIAVIANLVRIILLCIIAEFYGPEYTGGLVHDLSALLIFIVAFVLLMGLQHSMNWKIFSRP